MVAKTEKKAFGVGLGTGIGLVALIATGYYLGTLNGMKGTNPDISFTPTPSIEPYTPTPTPTLSPTQMFTETPTAEFGTFNHKVASVPHFNSGQEVAMLRGGDASKWVLKSESNSVTYTDGDLHPRTETRAKDEWIYNGDQHELNDPMPQSEQEAAQMFGIDEQYMRLIRITHDTNSAAYSPWMDRWTVPDNTVVGIEFIQNHGTDITAYEGDQSITLFPGWTAEMYDDRQNANDLDNVSAVLYNDGDAPIRFIASGATLWSMANPEALQLEQANQGITATDHYIHNGQQINNLRSASNFVNPVAATYIVDIESDGRVVETGFSIPGKGIIDLE